ncbi:MAG: hypothetical protein J5879_06215 [Clostridia bacterium]|nr:hypothetical protein [Clostridia bacterium]
MKIVIRQLSYPPDIPREYAVEAAVKRCRKAGIKVNGADICRISVDSRKKNDIRLVYSVLLECDSAAEKALSAAGAEAVSEDKLRIAYGDGKRNGKIAVIGFGPAGIFASLLLAENGYATVVYDRGKDVDERAKDVDRFLKTGVLDCDSNVQFGAGGAGTFSDGKLITRINDPACGYVLRRLVEFGAPEDILYSARPHVGTDVLRTVIRNITSYLQSRGVSFRFGCRVTDVKEKNGGIILSSISDDVYYDAAVLAAGHSGRDVFLFLHKNGLLMEKKPFSVGCRIEHLQSDIDLSMYGADHEKYRDHLPHAEYNLSYKIKEGTKERGVYSFCMCPGGKVICTSTEPDGIVTNGMSYRDRNGKNACSAVAVSVFPKDLPSDLFSGVRFQRDIERAAFDVTGGFSAPCQTVGSFLRGEENVISTVVPTYEPSVVMHDLNGVFPPFVSRSLKIGISEFEKKIRGFSDSRAVLTAPETRTSSPLRILRTADGFSERLTALYPCGEGAGYAGGITSAAADGINTAIKIMRRFKPDKI